MSIQIEHTDTFGGEANYCWVNRWYCKEDLTDKQAIRLAKRLTGFTGHRCAKQNYGEIIDLRPQGVCHVIFITYAESGYEQGKEVDRHGDLVEEKE